MVTKNSQIVGSYGELISLFENWIISQASNIDGWKSNVPASYKAGWSGLPFGSAHMGRDNNQAYVTYITSSNNLSTTTSSVVRTQFRDYMKSTVGSTINNNNINNLAMLNNTIITGTEVVWLLDHVINFIIHKLVIVVDNLNPGVKIVMYNPNNAVNKSAISDKRMSGLNITSVKTTSSDIQTLINQLNATLINKLRIESVKYNKSFTSSSSCSSSSSSSSSMFIAHVS